MAKGHLFLSNPAEGATLRGGRWALGLDALKTRRLEADPARNTEATDPAASQILVDFGRRTKVSALAMHGTTLQRGAQIRVVAGEGASVADDGAVSLDVVDFDSDWQDCFGRAHHTADLDWSDPNYWDGKPLDEDLDAYGRPVIVPLPTLETKALVIRLDNAGDPDFDLGHLFAAAPLVPVWNYTFGREPGFNTRTLTDETPGGARIADRRPGRQTHRVSFPHLQDSEIRALRDAHKRRDRTKPVLFVPDVENGLDLIRDAFLAAIGSISTTQDKRNGEWTAEIELEEVLG